MLIINFVFSYSQECKDLLLNYLIGMFFQTFHLFKAALCTLWNYYFR
jgi:hypothetical protein